MSPESALLRRTAVDSTAGDDVSSAAAGDGSASAQSGAAREAKGLRAHLPPQDPVRSTVGRLAPAIGPCARRASRRPVRPPQPTFSEFQPASCLCDPRHQMVAPRTTNAHSGTRSRRAEKGCPRPGCAWQPWLAGSTAIRPQGPHACRAPESPRHSDAAAQRTVHSPHGSVGACDR